MNEMRKRKAAEKGGLAVIDLAGDLSRRASAGADILREMETTHSAAELEANAVYHTLKAGVRLVAETLEEMNRVFNEMTKEEDE